MSGRVIDITARLPPRKQSVDEWAHQQARPPRYRVEVQVPGGWRLLWAAIRCLVRRQPLTVEATFDEYPAQQLPPT